MKPATSIEKVCRIFDAFRGKSTLGITEYDKLPKKAKEYLSFLERETGAKIGMISTGPDRAQTIFVDEFQKALG